MDNRVKEEIEEVRNLWIQWQGEEHSKGLEDDTIILMALKNYKEMIVEQIKIDKKIKEQLNER